MESPTGDFELKVTEGSKLSEAVRSALAGIPLGDKSHSEVFQVLVNGHIVEPEMWEFVVLKEQDNVLIVPSLKSGENGQMFKQFLILVVTLVATAYFPPAASIGNALIIAGATIGATLALNALIPPPTLEANNGLGGDSGLDSSQMYAITGQSNQVRKFKTVPKVYGSHRIYPPVAANPYTDLEVDSSTKDIVQYLYAIYDLGLGPITVEEIKIGDTPINNFSDYQVRLVDLNKPDTSEGHWDDVLEKDFRYYKSDVEPENVTVTLDGNRSSGGAQDTYEAIRNSAVNNDSYDQEISLTFINTKGLFGFTSNGSTISRSVDLEVYVSKVGEPDNWIHYNDPNNISNFSFVGGDEVYADIKEEFLPFGTLPEFGSNTITPPLSVTSGTYHLLSESVNSGSSTDKFFYDPAGYYFTTSFKVKNYGLKKGVSISVPLKTSSITVGQALHINGEYVGRVDSISTMHDFPGYSLYYLDQPIPKDLILYSVGYVQNSGYNGAYGKLIFYRDGSEDVQLEVVSKFKLLGKARITRAEQNQVYSTLKVTPKVPGQYKVRVTRVNSFSTQPVSQSQDSLTWASLVTRIARPPIVTDKRHVFLELRIRATNQLNGTISNLSAVTTSVLDTWDGTQWVKKTSRNPAWVFTDLLIGQVNKRAIPKSRLHLPSLYEWAQFCDQVPTPPSGSFFDNPRFQCDFILDYDATLQTVLGQVSSAAQASLNIIDGKYGVLIDKKRTVPVQIFTPRNSSNFSSTRAYTAKPHALKIKYVDPGVDWQVQELTVYDDGYDANTATEFDELNSFAVTNTEQAWRFGRYMLAQNRLRQETISLTVDFEYLVCTRGDYVQITQDIMKVGGTPARVKSVSGSQVIIDNAIESVAGSYGFVFRGSDGAIKTNTLTILNSTTFNFNGPDLPEEGDLVIIGLVGFVTYDCIVKSITPNDDLTANLVLVEKADAVYDAESLNVFPPYNPQLNATTNPDFASPGVVEDLAVITNDWECLGSSYQYYVTLDWDAPTDSAFEIFYVYVNSGRGFNKVGETKESQYKYIVDSTRLDIQHDFKVVAVSATGKKLDLGSVPFVSATPITKITPPPDVENFGTDITAEVLQLRWDKVDSCDIQEYLIRYSPSLSGTWTASIPLLRVSKNVNSASTQARVGTYLIKAVDFNSNESENASVAITTIPSLVNLNAIASVTDFPSLNGQMDRTLNSSGQLVLQKAVMGGPGVYQFYSEGYYYYDALLDLSEIYTVRLQSLIQAEGLTEDDIMANWATLSSISTLTNAGTSDWDVQAEYRASDTFNSIADWTSLSSIAQMDVGAAENFTAWKPFIMNDATGRIFQFRLKLVSNKPSVSPRVFDGTIKADMPDRIERYNNLSAGTSGLAVVYIPSFAGPGTSPNVQITLENGQAGDYWTFDYKTLNGFKIRFYNSSNNPVTRTFDAAVNGYGRKAAASI